MEYLCHFSPSQIGTQRPDVLARVLIGLYSNKHPVLVFHKSQLGRKNIPLIMRPNHVVPVWYPSRLKRIKNRERFIRYNCFLDKCSPRSSSRKTDPEKVWVDNIFWTSAALLLLSLLVLWAQNFLRYRV